MGRYIIIELLVMTIVFFITNLMKHYQLLIMPDIFFQIDSEFKEESLGVYMMVSYLSFFYGTLVGQVLFQNFFEKKVGATFSIFLSMMAMALYSFLQAFVRNIPIFFILRFLLGASMNMSKAGKIFIHDIISKKYRQPAFFLDSASYTMGVLSGPFFGLLAFNYKPDFRSLSIWIGAILALLALLHYVIFYSLKRDDLPKRMSAISHRDEERISFLKKGSFIKLSWKNAIAHALWDNTTSRALIIILVVNYACFQIDLVLTTLFLLDKTSSGDFRVGRMLIGQGNMFGAIGSFITIIYFSNKNRSPKFYTNYMYITILVNSLTAVMTPYLKEIMKLGWFDENYFFWGFFMIKFGVCYYLYSSILEYLISVSIFKLFRKPLMFALRGINSTFSAFVFNVVTPILYIVSGKKFENTSFNHLTYTIFFWVIAICQLATLFQFKYLEDVLGVSNMIS